MPRCFGFRREIRCMDHRLRGIRVALVPLGRSGNRRLSSHCCCAYRSRQERSVLWGDRKSGRRRIGLEVMGFSRLLLRVDSGFYGGCPVSHLSGFPANGVKELSLVVLQFVLHQIHLAAKCSQGCSGVCCDVIHCVSNFLNLSL